MADYHEYDSIAEGIKIEDITSNEENAEFLRRLKANCPELESLTVSRNPIFRNQVAYYNPGVRDFGWLGYFIGKNTSVTRMCFDMRNAGDGNGIEGLCGNDEAIVDKFCRGICRNKTIRQVFFWNLQGGKAFQQLIPFFRNNHNLTRILLWDCNLGTEGTHLLSRTLAGCSKSLKNFHWNARRQGREFGEGGLVDVILALSMHLRLKNLGLTNTNSIGHNECMALATLMQCTQLRELALQGNTIDDEGVEMLVQGLAGNTTLRALILNNNAIGDTGVDLLTAALTDTVVKTLALSYNGSISTEGCKSLLKSTSHNLEKVVMGSDNVDYDWKDVFVSLANNYKLKTFIICCRVSNDEWAALSKVLCDTSTINNIHSSNHTLYGIRARGIPDDVKQLLKMNETANKNQVAMKKMLKHHPHFDMQPLFDWEFKALPHVINWFALARNCRVVSKKDIKSRKLSTIYQFIRAMPLLYIEGRAKAESNENRASRLKSRREQLELDVKLREVEMCEALAKKRKLV